MIELLRCPRCTFVVEKVGEWEKEYYKCPMCNFKFEVIKEKR
jgi:uncharacterized C2H2 Zn-finger protein